MEGGGHRAPDCGPLKQRATPGRKPTLQTGIGDLGGPAFRVRACAEQATPAARSAPARRNQVRDCHCEKLSERWLTAACSASSRACGRGSTCRSSRIWFMQYEKPTRSRGHAPCADPPAPQCPNASSIGPSVRSSVCSAKPRPKAAGSSKSGSRRRARQVCARSMAPRESSRTPSCSPPLAKQP